MEFAEGEAAYKESDLGCRTYGRLKEREPRKSRTMVKSWIIPSKNNQELNKRLGGGRGSSRISYSVSTCT